MNYPKPASSAPLEGPLARHLRELAEGTRPFPETAARRHHFVPSFALAKFATPAKREGVLYELDTATGKPARTTPDRSAFVEELYSQESEEGQNRSLEAYLSVVENYAAQAIGRLLTSPLELSGADRQTISYYLAFQYQRTPVVIEHSMAMAQATMEMLMGVHFSDEQAFMKNYRAKIDATASDEEIAELRERTLASLQSGGVTFTDPKARAFELMLKSTDEVARTIFGFDWVVLRTLDAEFVTSDRAIAMHDPTPKFEWSGHALKSSDNAETTIPLSPELCLLLRPGSCKIASAEVEDAAVRELNLRTYGWATRHIYGSSQQAVTLVRQQAKRHPELVTQPRTPKPVLLEAADRNDPSVGAEHAAKGWPRGVMIPGEDGKPQFASYTLIDPAEAGAGAAAIAADEAAQRVTRPKRRR